jgi:hypothetical protein
MAGNRDLRLQLDERLQGALKLLLAQYGLAVVQVDTLSLRHDKFDANRERVASLWLVADQRHVEIEHAKHLDDLYDAEEWQRIRREEQESRLRHRRTELQHDETIARAELGLQSAERAHAVRAREIDLYARIVEAKSRRQAIDRGAGDVLAELEHDLAKKSTVRAGEAAEWEHVRALAKIRMRTELEVAQQDASQARQLAQQRFSHQLLQQQVRNKIEQAAQIEDAVRQRAELVRLREREQALAHRAREIEEEEHEARRQLLALAHAARRREAERVLEWEEEQAQDRKRELLRAGSLLEEETRQKLEAMRRGGAQMDAIAQHEKLLRTIEADAQHQRKLQEVQLDADARRHALRREEQEALWQHELRRFGHERADKAAQHAHALDLARLEIARAESLAAMDDSAKLALAAAPNAAALADVMKTRIHATMGADQLAALAGVAAASNGVPALDAARMAQDAVRQEREQRDAQLEQDRRNQRELLAIQNDVNKAALASQAQLGAAIASRGQCAHGPAERGAGERCATCGAAL